MISIVDYFEALLKIQLFVGVRNLYVASADQSFVSALNMRRARIRLKQKDKPQVFEGMAEAPLAKSAYLFALAEAYEKYCVWSFEIESGRKLDIRYAYGVGVGFRANSALCRAWGEFYERQTLTNESRSAVALQQATPAGSIFLHKVAAESGLIGTGYGMTPSQAALSARRSLYRKEEWGLENKKFKIHDLLPQAIRITPKLESWLECYLIGKLD